jgi:hypothetical protein
VGALEDIATKYFNYFIGTLALPRFQGSKTAS